MTHTATFTDSNYKLVPSTRKNGRAKWESVTTEVTDTLNPIQVKFNGTTKTFYTRTMQENETGRRLDLFNADGTYARGTWRHGREGSKMHNDTLEIYRETRKLVTQDAYASGQIKDQHKYLLAI